MEIVQSSNSKRRQILGQTIKYIYNENVRWNEQLGHEASIYHYILRKSFDCSLIFENIDFTQINKKSSQIQRKLKN